MTRPVQNWKQYVNRFVISFKIKKKKATFIALK